MTYKHDLEFDISRSDKILELLEDRSFADELYCALTNMMWLKLGIDTEEQILETLRQRPILYDESWTASFRYVGGMISGLRNPVLRLKGEPLEGYMDFYCSRCEVDGEVHGEGFVSPRVKQALAELGWFNFEYKEEE